MSRPRYPSDEKRLKMRPHVKVHLTVATHPKTAAVWANPRLRGMLVELWRLAEEAFAGRRGGQLTLTAGPLQSLTGASKAPRAIHYATTLFDLLGYKWTRNGDVLTVTIRNFDRKQHGNSADSGATPRTPSASYSDSDSDTDTEEEETEPPARTRPRLLNLLSKQRGTEPEKLAWLERELPLLEAEHCEGKDPPARRVVAWWRQHVKTHGLASERAAKAEAAAARARERAEFEAQELDESDARRMALFRGRPP